MQIIVFTILIVVFFYSLYKFVRDDYVFIRKNISLEQIFDVAFGTLWISLLFARAFYFVIHPVNSGENLLFTFFSPGQGGLSLFGGVIGGIVGLYIIGKYRKLPLGRFYDFFALSFLITLPFGFISLAPFAKGMELYFHLVFAFLYVLCIIFFMKVQYPKIMNRTLKEGSLSIYFFIIFFLLTMLHSMMQFKDSILLVMRIESIFSAIFLALTLVVLVKQEIGSARNKKSSIKQ